MHTCILGHLNTSSCIFLQCKLRANKWVSLLASPFSHPLSPYKVSLSFWVYTHLDYFPSRNIFENAYFLHESASRPHEKSESAHSSAGYSCKKTVRVSKYSDWWRRGRGRVLFQSKYIGDSFNLIRTRSFCKARLIFAPYKWPYCCDCLIVPFKYFVRLSMLF